MCIYIYLKGFLHFSFRLNISPPLKLRRLFTTTSTIMPRRSSGGRSAPRARPAPARSPPPQTVNHAPPPAPAQGGGGSMLGGLGSTIAQGMMFGTGSAVAHRAVDAIAGPRTIQHEHVGAEAPAAAYAPTANSIAGAEACGMQTKAFQDCLNNYGSDITKCQFYMDMLSECRRNSGSTINA